ncbi:MAG: cupredoxin domain-containing protein [Actinomycetota bacterium]
MRHDLDAAAEAQRYVEPPPDGGVFGWGRLQALAALAVLGSLLVPMLISFSFEPFIVSMAAPLAIGLLLLVTWPRVGAIWLGVVSLGLLVFSAPFLVEALTHPESMADFIPLSFFTVGCVVGAVAAIPTFRERARPDATSSTPRMIAMATGALLVVAAVVSIIAFAGIESVPAQGGDIRLVAEDIAFRPKGITVENGEVSVHVANLDGTRHTFTIDELGVDLNVPPNTDERITFTAGPGTYRFYCRPHAPGMEGVLVLR